MAETTKTLAIVHNVKTSHKAIALCEVWTYDVWGNARDGFDVNDRCCIERRYPIEVTMEVSNVPAHPGAKDEYRSFPADSASFSAELAISFCLTDKQVKEALGVKGAVDIDGDDTHYEVSKASNGRPLGEVNIIGWERCD